MFLCTLIVPCIYQPRRPRASPLWQLVHHGCNDFLVDYEKSHRKTLVPLHPAAVTTVQSFHRRGDLACGFPRETIRPRYAPPSGST